MVTYDRGASHPVPTPNQVLVNRPMYAGHHAYGEAGSLAPAYGMQPPPTPIPASSPLPRRFGSEAPPTTVAVNNRPFAQREQSVRPARPGEQSEYVDRHDGWYYETRSASARPEPVVHYNQARELMGWQGSAGPTPGAAWGSEYRASVAPEQEHREPVLGYPHGGRESSVRPVESYHGDLARGYEPRHVHGQDQNHMPIHGRPYDGGRFEYEQVVYKRG